LTSHFVEYIPWIVNLQKVIVVVMDNGLNLLKQSIARYIKERRKALGLSQEELADLAEIDRTYASQIERGIANPSLEVLYRVAVSLQTELPKLMGTDSV